MPNNFFKSTEVKLYPTAYRGYTTDNKLYNPESRLPSENNLSNISYYLTQKREGFVVSKEGNEIVFVLKGYQFRVDISSINTWPKNYLWVAIKLKARGNISDTTNTDYADYSLDTFKTVTGVESGSTNSDVLDDGTADGDFCALVYDFADSATVSPFDNDTYSLCICFKLGTKIIIPKSSQLMLKTNHIENANTHEPLTDIFEHEIGLNEKSVSIKSLGEFDAHDLTDNFSPTQDTTNEIHVLSDMAQNSIGKITPTEKTLPLASDNGAGLVSTLAQSFSGTKTFKDGIESAIHYGNFAVCGTDANVLIKDITIPNFNPSSLIDGMHIYVMFTKGNTNREPILRINSLGLGTSIMIDINHYATKALEANTIVELVYHQASNLSRAWYVVGYRKNVEHAEDADWADEADWAEASGHASESDKVVNKLTLQLNSSNIEYDGSESKTGSFYAPTSSGTSGNILKSNGSGNTPTWVEQKTIGAGKLLDANGSSFSAGDSYTPVYFDMYGHPVAASNMYRTNSITGYMVTDKTEIAYGNSLSNITGASESSWYKLESGNNLMIYMIGCRIGFYARISFHITGRYLAVDQTLRINMDMLIKKVFGSAASKNSNYDNYITCIVTPQNNSSDNTAGVTCQTDSTYIYITNDQKSIPGIFGELTIRLNL